MDLPDLAQLPAISRFIERCLVDTIPAGTAPKDVTIQLPDADGAKVSARYTGFPPGLAVSDEVSVRATPQDPIKYVVTGTSGATADVGGRWPFDNIITVSTTNPNADESDLATAISNASIGDAIWLDAEIFTITSNLAVNKKLFFLGTPGATKITLSTAGTSTIFNTADGTKFFGIEIENTVASGTNGACVATNQDIDLIQCVLTKTGASTNGYGVWIFTNAVTVNLDNVKISSTGSGTNYGIKTDSATVLNLFGGECIATDLPVYVGHTGTSLNVQGDPIFGISTTVTMPASNLIITTNASGLTANFGDVGLLDEAGDYDDTATEGDNVAWCIALTDSINNAAILVKRRGNAIVNYTSTAPNASEFLITSTLAGLALASATMRPEIFAVATAAGSGGTVAVQLLTGSVRINVVSSNFLYANIGSGNFAAPFAAVIDDNAGAHGGQGLDATNVPYDTVTGNVDTLPAVVNTYLSRVRLYNSTRSTYREIEYVDTVNTVIKTASSTDSWADNDVIVCVSQVIGAGAAIKHYDLKFRDTATVPLLARAIAVQVQARDSAVGAPYDTLHPLEAYAGPKLITIVPQVNSIYLIGIDAVLDLVNGAIGWSQRASGAATNTVFLSIKGYNLAVP